MKGIMGKIRRTLSILLAVTMVVTCIPQAGLTAKAVEPDAASAVEDMAGEDISLTGEDGDVVNEDIDVDEGEENEESQEVSDEEADETPVADEFPAAVETPAAIEEAADSGEDGIADPEEDIADDAEANISVLSETKYDLDVQVIGDEEEAEKISVILDDSLKDVASLLILDCWNRYARVTRAAGQVLTFTVDGYTPADNKKLHVYYLLEGYEDDLHRAEIEPDQDGRYTVPAAEIARVIDKIDIKLVVEKQSKSTVTFTANDKVDVKVQGKDASGKDAWVDIDNATAVTKAFCWRYFQIPGKGQETLCGFQSKS